MTNICRKKEISGLAEGKLKDFPFCFPGRSLKAVKGERTWKSEVS